MTDRPRSSTASAEPTDHAALDDPEAAGVPLSAYAAVVAHTSYGIPLEQSLEHQAIDPSAWPEVQRAWARRIAEDAAHEGTLAEQFDHFRAVGEAHVERRLPPLDTDIVAWTRFFRAATSSAEPMTFLRSRGLHEGDLIRLVRYWNDRAQSEDEQKKLLEGLAHADGPLPSVTPEPPRLRPEARRRPIVVVPPLAPQVIAPAGHPAIPTQRAVEAPWPVPRPDQPPRLVTTPVAVHEVPPAFGPVASRWNPAVPAANLDETRTPVPTGRPPLPFSAPAERDSLTGTAPPKVREEPTLPFVGVDGRKARGPRTRLGLDAYALLCVELAAHPGSEAETLASYGLSAETKVAEDAAWRARFAAEPALHARWRQLVNLPGGG